MPCCSCVLNTTKPKNLKCSCCDNDIKNNESYLICIKCLVVMHLNCYNSKRVSKIYMYCDKCKSVASIGSVSN